MDSRPDQEMEQAINKFLQWLEKQEKKGFNDIATLSSQLPKPAQGSARSMSLSEAMEAGFLPALDEDQAHMRVVPVWTRSGPQVTNLGYPGLLSYPSLFC